MQVLKKLNNDKSTNWPMRGAVILFLFVSVSCGSNNNDKNKSPKEVQIVESEALHKQVTTFHDEVMPDMGKLYEIEKALKARIETLGDTESEQLTILKDKSAQVKAAQDNMMNWMRAFHKNYNGDTTESVKAKVLKKELNKIEKISSEMKSALKVDPSL